MSLIEDIKYRIDQLDGGTFQCLCDTLLYKLGYKNIYSLGMKTGTNKTATGNPDTYFVDPDIKYTLVMYTTQKSDFKAKAKADFDKCFTISNLGIENIKEIIFCHTYGRLTPGDDKELKEYCIKKGAKLILYGIDEIAGKIYYNYQFLAQEYLNLSVDSGQILETENFIKEHDRSSTAAPLAMDFMFRDEDIKIALEKLASNKILLLTGDSGAGKTKMALRLGEIYQGFGYKSFCLVNKDIPIFTDLNRLIEHDTKYCFIIDDANEFKYLENILREIDKNIDKNNFKIIMTVRNYIKRDVTKQIAKYELPAVFNIGVFSRDEIESLMNHNFKITNKFYIDKVYDISKGNARIAILTGKLIDDGVIRDLNNLDTLYKYYYYNQINCLKTLGEKAFKLAAIIAFFGSVNFSLWRAYEKIFLKMSLSKEDFKIECRKLHQNEIVNIYNDKVVKFSDQTFRDYLIKYLLVDEKYITLHEVIDILFVDHANTLYTNTRMLINKFGQEQNVKKEVDLIWDKMKEDKDLFIKFLKMFCRFKPIETIDIVNDYINSLEYREYNLDYQKDFETNENLEPYGIEKDYLYILQQFKYNQSFPCFIELLLKYFEKRPQLAEEIVRILCDVYGIDKFSHIYKYENCRVIIDKITNFVKVNPSDNNIIIFLRIARYYLKYAYDWSEMLDNRSGGTYRLKILKDKVVFEYRKSLLAILQFIYSQHKFENEILKVIEEYIDCTLRHNDYEIFLQEFPFVIYFFEKAYDNKNTRNILLLYKLNYLANLAGIKDKQWLDKFSNTKEYRILSELIFFDWWSYDMDYEVSKKIHEEKIRAAATNINNDEINYIFSLLNKPNSETIYDNNIVESLGFIFDTILASEDGEKRYFTAVELYLEHNTPLEIIPVYFIRNFIKCYDVEHIEKIIDKYQFNAKDDWLWTLYTNIPKEKISLNYLKKLYILIKADKSGKYWIRNLTDLKSFKNIEPDIIVKATKLLLKELKKNPGRIFLYVRSLFLKNQQEILAIYQNDIDILERLYLVMISQETNFDYIGDLFVVLVENDNDFIFKYIDIEIANNLLSCDSTIRRLKRLWSLKNKNEILEIVNEYIFKKKSIYMGDYLQGLFNIGKTCNQEALTDCLKSIIHKHSDEDGFMVFLFSEIATMEDDIREKMILYLLKENTDIELFRKISLDSGHWSTSNGSFLAAFEKDKDFLLRLLKKINKIEYIKHQKRIEDNISFLDRRIEEEQIRLLLDE